MACWSGYSQRYGPCDEFGSIDTRSSFLGSGRYPLSGPPRESATPSLLTDKFDRPFAKWLGKATPPPARVASAGPRREQK